MVIVRIMPKNGDVLGKIRARYPGATMKHLTIDPGRFAVSLPSKDAQTWTEAGDATFFNDLVKQKVLSWWGIIGGPPGV